VLNLDELEITDHFKEMLIQRAPYLVRNVKGGGFIINMLKLEIMLSLAKEIERKDSIFRKIKHRGEARFYDNKVSKKKKRLVFVIANKKLITVYPYYGSFADKGIS